MNSKNSIPAYVDADGGALGSALPGPAKDRGDSVRDGFGGLRDLTTGQTLVNRPGGAPLPGALPIKHGGK